MSELHEDPSAGDKFVDACKFLYSAKCEHNAKAEWKCGTALDSVDVFTFVEQ